MRLLALGKSGKIRVRFVANSQSRQEAVNGNSASLQTKEREAVVSSLPITMHTGQIILLTKTGSACYRTGSGSDRIQALNRVLQIFRPEGIVDCELNIGSGRYRSRFCNDQPTLRDGVNLMKCSTCVSHLSKVSRSCLIYVCL
jgi:hypothetical protein